MFNALDHLTGLQLIFVLSPVVLIMVFVRKREEKASSMVFGQMNSLQKGWVFLSLLSPGLCAKVLNGLEQEERERVLSAGAELSGSERRVSLAVVDRFFEKTSAGNAPSKDLDEICRYLNLKYADSSKILVSKYRKAYF